ncbi:MAG TPA: hypothetical protein VL979_07505 [Solirubrobacteraceae bacterium]|nr:hypothetical protein [Solirubrobacteraceae bacterium]
MSDPSPTSNPPDIGLILRAHGEQLWLAGEVTPTVRELEQPGCVPEEQLGAALAYLELLWFDARRRAAETDAAAGALEREGARRDRVLYERARRYYVAVRRLRDSLSVRVGALTGAPSRIQPRRRLSDRYASS